MSDPVVDSRVQLAPNASDTHVVVAFPAAVVKMGNLLARGSSPPSRGEVALPPRPDRASAADLMQFATGDGRAAGHIGAVLVLDAAPGCSLAGARRVLGERIGAVPRLRQRLYRAPPGCGRPYWADDPAFDIDEHVRQVCCPPPGTSGR